MQDDNIDMVGTILTLSKLLDKEITRGAKAVEHLESIIKDLQYQLDGASNARDSLYEKTIDLEKELEAEKERADGLHKELINHSCSGNK
jgi:predicted RNase H-like nuclease (RuvC/YqgF family)